MRERQVGPFDQVFSLVFAILLLFTVALLLLSFPAGFYAVFGPGSGLEPWSSTARLFLLLGPFEVVLPIVANVGAYFIFLNLIYFAMFVYLFTLPRSPLSAIAASFREGLGAFVTSPLLLSAISISFLIFTASWIDALAPVSGPPTSLLGLANAPLVEEFGFRVLMIGIVVALFSLRLPWKGIVGVLWRPSSGYSGDRAGGAVRIAAIVMLFVSSLVFGAAHVLSGWNLDKIFEATYGGVVLGYLYIRYGFAVAVLAHWGIDYFDTVYAYLGQTAFGVPVTAQPEFFLQGVVDLDMVRLMGLASFLLVVYLGLKRLQARSEASEVHKGAAEGSAFGI
ncbi:MAG TPA: CPBP family glutamic-type intramembrane protease [Nitrososphaerales archaeon]|nr:CPBP family glutamic-type intramembrane protease [Nitrososphaerales archaeon]